MIDLQRLPFVETADVYKRDALAGHLTRSQGGVEFSYSRSYMDTGGPAVATSLPVSPEPTFSPAGAVPPFFANLLPEGRRLTALRRAVKTSADDDLTLLLAVGADLPGDVVVLPAGESPYEVAAQVEVERTTDVSFDEIFAATIGLEPDRVSLPGVQEKVSARMISMPVARRADRFILKLNPPEFPHLVENEAFFIEAAKRTGISTVEAQVVRDRNDVPGLLVRRFDRVAVGDTVRSLAFEDGCQVMARYPAQKYGITAEAVTAALSRVTRSPKVAARELLSQLVFGYVTGNGDAHAKNLAVLQGESGEWRVSPAFDLPSSYPYGDTTFALSVARSRGPDLPLRAFLQFSEALGLPERAARAAIADVVSRVDTWLPDLPALPFDSGRIQKLRKVIQYRRRLLGG
ncbi:MAG: type II toxin-antitoxin system HipA family toxin [Hamadaea sp.]|nr:type II toxin-antitoxin system HipA family toxin [Hamadaea sp.]